MNENYALPRPQRLLGEALRPVWQKVAAELEKPAQNDMPMRHSPETLRYGMEQLLLALARVAAGADMLSKEVFQNDAASDEAVQAAVARFDASLNGLLAGYAVVRGFAVQGEDVYPNHLLGRAYRHGLTQVCDWLHELTETLANPMAALCRRGLPEQGEVSIHLPLGLTPAPEMTELSNWMDETRRARLLAPPRQESGGTGFLGAVCAGVLGWGIGNALFGDD